MCRLMWVVCAALAMLVYPRIGCGDLLPDIVTGPRSVKLTLVADGISGVEPGTGVQQYAPTDLAVANDGSGRLFIATLGGLVRVIDGSGNLLAAPFLDTTNGDTFIDPENYGMTSIEFHPGFADPGSPGYRKLYAITTEAYDTAPADFSASHQVRANENLRPQSVLTEWTVDDVTANTFSGTSRELMRIQQPGDDHNVNDLAFDENGLLYISSGDGDNAANTTNLTYSDNAVDLDKVFGKILRIDPTDTTGGQKYGIPTTNPFFGQAGVVEEIYSYGHRNPYRINFDADTGDLYDGEVGQTQIEEVNLVVAGENYGWNLKEGSFIYHKASQNSPSVDQDMDMSGVGDFAEANGLTEPLFEYDHTEGRSVTGGFIYRGSLMPQLGGMYIFGDWIGQGVSRLFYGDPATGDVFEFAIGVEGENMPLQLLSIGQDEDHELYVLGVSFTGTGVVLKLGPVPGDADGDGDADLDDYDILSAHMYEATANGPADGDFNNDGVTDFEDFVTLALNFTDTPGAESIGDLPEPAVLTALVMVVGMMGRVWRYR